MIPGRRDGRMVEAALTLLLLTAPGDGEVTAGLLEDSDAVCIRCADVDELLQRIEPPVGAILIAEEMLTAELVERLAQRLMLQPPWSDLPVLVVAQAEHHPGLMAALGGLGSVSLLRRPMSTDEFISAVGAAFRARRRQFQVRDLMHQQAEQSRRKDDFLAMLAHELRNPLAPIRYAARILVADGVSAEHLQKIGHLVERQVGHMGRIINDLLETTRVLRGIIEIRPQRMNLAAIVRDAVESARSLAEERGIALRASLDGDVEVMADPTRVRQVADNLVDNAIKFSPEGATVDISVSHSEQHAVLVVKDEGDGITAALLPHIFEPFIQADQSIDRQRGGLGLGLALVRNLVRLQHGEVTVQSDGPGRGSRFTVHLPLALAPEWPSPGLTQEEAAAERALRIVIAEDNVDSAHTLRLLLELDGHEVSVVHTGIAAVDEVRRVIPDALVCDIGLPGLSGYEVARALRRDPHMKAVRFIALTGYGSPEDRDRALASGFDAHLAKPVDPGVLGEELARVNCAPSS